MKRPFVLLLATWILVGSCSILREQRDYSYLKKYPDIRACEHFCRDFPKSKHFTEVNGMLHGLYEIRDWNASLQKNDIATYIAFVTNYPQSSYVSQANKKLEVLYEERDYKKAVASDSIVPLKNFIVHYPLSERKDEIEKRITRLQEEQDWGNTCTIDNIEAYKDFLLRYPQSLHRFDANARILMIPEWEQVKKQNTEQAYRRFIVKHPYCKYADDARNALAVYDDAYWKKISGTNTLEVYKDYLSAYPKGIHEEEAKKKIIDLKVDNIFNGKYKPVPSLVNNNNAYYSKESLVSIKNDSPYRLTVLYSGPDTKEVEIEPKGVTDIRLANGTYRIAVSTNVLGVSNFAGTQLLEGSIYELPFFISQKR